MLVDLQWVRMAKERLALIDATPRQDIEWISDGITVNPVGRSAPLVKNTDIAVLSDFEEKIND